MSFDFKGFGSALNDFGAAASLFGSSAASSAAVPGYLAEAQGYDTASATAIQSGKLTGVATDIQKAQTQRQLFQVIGGARADVAGAGLAEKGSALDVIRSSREQGELQLRMIDTQGSIQQGAFAQQAAAYNAESSSARANAAAAQSSANASKGGGFLKVLGGIASIAALFI